jgi:MFS family permease
MQHAQAGKSGQYFGLFFMCWSASVLISPALGGQLYGHFGGHSVWLASAAMALLSIPLFYQATRLSEQQRLLSSARSESASLS